MEAQSAGDLQTAERCYLAVLQLDPEDPDALHLLGIVHHQSGRRKEAREFLSKAVAIEPDAALFQFNLAEALRAEDVFEEAARHYERAEKLDSSLIAVHLPLSECVASLGRMKEAAGHLAKALPVADGIKDLMRLARCAQVAGALDLAIDAATRASVMASDNVEVLDLLASLLTRKGTFAPLVEIYKRLISLDPMDRYYIGLASAYAECRDYDAAKAAARHALELFPTANQAHFILGHCAERQSDWLAAAHHYAEVVKADPKHVPSLVNLAVALRSSGCPLEALDCLREAQRQAPENFEVVYNLADSYEKLGKLDEAIEMSRRALELRPDHPSAINLLGSTLQKKRRSREALELLEPFVQQHPDDCLVHGALASIYLDRGELAKARESFRRSVDPSAPQPPVNGNLLLSSTYDDTLSPRELFDLHVAWGLQQGDPALPAPRIADPNRQKIRIGYVSPDLRQHSVAFFICPVLMFHDKSAFEIYCYADVQNPDKVTEMFQSHADHWRNIAGVPDERLFEMVRRDEIDILIDLAGHTGGTRLPFFSRRPAPIQAGMIGYPCTTGLPAIDYQITDPIIHPPGLNEPLATEKLVRLPHIFACYRPPDNAPPVQPLPALTAGHITFGYFNNLAKLRDSVLRAWALIAARLPTARFVIQTSALDDPAALEIVTNRCLAAGMPQSCLDIRGQSSLSRFHDDLNTVDIGLDPFPFNGHTTSCQMLHMGVPIVTLSGKTRSSRMGASLMCNLGLQHLVAHSPEEYADIAVRLASDLPKLAAIRAALRDRMETSPIMNAPLYVQNLERAYRMMWQTALNAAN
ncbi:MAG TPA: tetratricopeptide repeat protein [Phycisphaerae bacterium]|nr:tetratricopeptide repeat protein [Phycisphaerae bacterium]